MNNNEYIKIMSYEYTLLEAKLSFRGRELARTKSLAGLLDSDEGRRILAEVDADSDGNISLDELGAALRLVVRQGRAIARWKTLGLVLFVALTLALGVNAGLTFAVVESAKEVSGRPCHVRAWY